MHFDFLLLFDFLLKVCFMKCIIFVVVVDWD